MPASRPASSTNDTFAVRIQTPESLVWQGSALSLSTTNSAGRFDILPLHANMITIIERQPIEIVTTAGNRKFVFEKAVLAVKSSDVYIYANISAEKLETEDPRQTK